MGRNAKKEAWIRAVAVRLAPPSLKDNTGDADRLLKSLRQQLHTEAVRIPFHVLGSLPEALRGAAYRVTAFLFKDEWAWQLIGVRSQEAGDAAFGAAVDLGTSTIVVRLVELRTHAPMEEVSFHNPQIRLGKDILTRIHHAAEPGGLRELQQLLTGSINDAVRRMSERLAIPLDFIVGMSVAGNTAMTHFFLGLPPYWICREPYIPAVNRPALLTAGELGLEIHRGAPVLVFPNVGSYFGGDLMAGILASGMNRGEEICFLVDVGTNAEVVIGNRDWLVGCAGAAGPALEGGVAGMGMMAGPGVIDRVRIDPDTGLLRYRTIDDRPPVGICGSGLIDLVAQLFLEGMIDLRGKYIPERCGGRLVNEDGTLHFTVVPRASSGTGRALTLSQPDIDGLIRSKAAMYSILTTIADSVNIPLNDVRRFYIAGTFGYFIDPLSAITIGMIPDLPPQSYIPLGNTSLEGASMALVSAEDKEEINRIRDRITYLELNVNQEFMNRFSAARFIPHTETALFPSVGPRHGAASPDNRRRTGG